MAVSIAYPLYPGKQAQGDSEDLVFGTRRSRIDNPNNILRRQVFPACDRLEIPHATWLTFRRRWATWADNEHVGARTIADIQGPRKSGDPVHLLAVVEGDEAGPHEQNPPNCLQISNDHDTEPALVH